MLAVSKVRPEMANRTETLRKASGANIPEAQRTTVQVKLRLDVDVAEDLDALAARWGMNRSQCVARMVAKQHKRSDGGSERGS